MAIGKSSIGSSCSGSPGCHVIDVNSPFLVGSSNLFPSAGDGHSAFNLASGNVGILAGMGLLMELIIIGIFLFARRVIEPLSGQSVNKRHITSNDAEWTGNSRGKGRPLPGRHNTLISCIF